MPSDRSSPTARSTRWATRRPARPPHTRRRARGRRLRAGARRAPSSGATRAGANAHMRRPSGRSESEPPVRPAPGWSPGAPAKYEPRRSDAAPVPRPDVATGAGDARGLGLAIRAASAHGRCRPRAIETRSPPRSSASVARCPPFACATGAAIDSQRRSPFLAVPRSDGSPRRPVRQGSRASAPTWFYAGLIRGLKCLRTVLAEHRRRTDGRRVRATLTLELAAPLSHPQGCR